MSDRHARRNRCRRPAVDACLAAAAAAGIIAGIAGAQAPTPAPSAAAPGMRSSSPSVPPTVVERRVIDLTQTVTLDRIPAKAGTVRLWVPIPSDAAYQRVLSRQVVEAPVGWTVEPQSDGRGDFLFVEVRNPQSSSARVVVRSTVETEGVLFDLVGANAPEVDARLFPGALDRSAPLMEVDEKIRAIADAACGSETDSAKQAVILLKTVSSMADHYSKDPSKPKCGRGAALDCLDHGGGCCTDLHSLFIALARARGIPARMQYGYRALDSKAGPNAYDPGYRCWVEYFVPGLGWVPTDVVASDNAGESNPAQWGSLSAGRVWLWSGRSFELSPKSSQGAIDTMTCGWAEIDGSPVDPLPAADGTPPQLTRTIRFDILAQEKAPGTPKLPE